jgi:hypothetical protein
MQTLCTKQLSIHKNEHSSSMFAQASERAELKASLTSEVKKFQRYVINSFLLRNVD